MDADGILFKLADAAGIENHYWDMHGTRHETTPDGMRGLLNAFGVPAASDSDAWASLAVLGEAPWRSALPPVHVLREGEAVTIPLRLPMGDEGRTIRRTLRLENGGARSGECSVDSLAVEDTASLGERRIALRRLNLEPLPLGYHTFHLADRELASSQIIVAPLRGFVPARLTNRRAWGMMLQLYSLKSPCDFRE